jgi:hypothetical protein
MRSQTTPLRTQNDLIDPKEASVSVWNEANNPNEVSNDAVEVPKRPNRPKGGVCERVA